MLKRFSNMPYTTKLFLSVAVICIVSILISSGNGIRLATGGLNTLAEDAIKDGSQTMYNSLQMYDRNMRLKLDGDVAFFQKEIKSRGGLMLDDHNTIEETLVNQVSKESTTKKIPQMQLGVSFLNHNNELVDLIESITSSSATIFQLVDDKMLRIATTVKKLDGNRATGTYIPSDSPVYQTLMRGETFRGKAFVVNDWYLTAYTPIRDVEEKIIGAIYVGTLMLNPEVKKFVSDSKLGKGYFFAYAEGGEFLIHPTLDSSSNLYDIVPLLKGKKDTFVDYEYKGSAKVAYVMKLEEWGVYFGLTMNREDIMAGLDIVMFRNNLLVGLLVIGGGILVAFFLVRSINRPLKELADKSVKVGNGDYTVSFHSDNPDAIGVLTNSLGAMTVKSREMLKDIIGSAEALAEASRELATISQHMVDSADATTRFSDEAAVNAQEVSENMNSVSAAMEESTVNLDMIASASEEMGNTIKEIAENSARARRTTEEAVSSAQKSHAGVQDLGEAARAIGTVTETITEISEQTNLLALNATIEAARAGEAGKGFAVVANEIKELAKQTAGATGKIKEAIEEIQTQTGDTVKDIESISKVIVDVNDIVNSIVTAVEEQSITTNEIVNNVSQASVGISEINQNVANSSTMTSRMSDSVEHVKEQSLAVRTSSDRVSSSAENLGQLSAQLSKLVGQFKI